MKKRSLTKMEMSRTKTRSLSEVAVTVISSSPEVIKILQVLLKLSDIL
ncbi:hypothetical protein VAEU17_670002 [Vibrio aestuarianus]|nr:hypothetical protein VAEU17_670002 [Vibrio aestuarianus]